MGRFTTAVSKAIYAGIDYHKKFCMVTLGDAHGNVLEQCKLPNDKQTIIQFFRPLEGVICAIESCRGYQWLVELLQSLGIDVRICNTLKAKLIIQTKNKNDKIDSKKLMQLLAKGFLPECYQATPYEREIRERLRWRNQLVRSCTKLKVLISDQVDKENLGLDQKDLFSQKCREFLRSAELSDPRRMRVLQQLEMLEELELKVKLEDKWVTQQALKNDHCRLLMTVPGFGSLTSLALVAELGDINRFARANQVARYVGLTPSENSSADRRQLGPITKEGSKFLRWLLIQAAWKSLLHPAFKRRFSRIAHRTNRNTAVTAVARATVEIAFHILKEQKPFNENKLSSADI